METMAQEDILMDPLRKEIFRLSSYVASATSSGFRRNSASSLPSVSKILVGPPPESAAVSAPHPINCIVLVSGLPGSLTDSQLKKECIETIGRPKFIYMHVSDGRTGMFSGTAVIEFSEESHARKAVSSSVAACVTRLINPQEYASLTEGDWPMLEYGAPRGVFAPGSVPAQRPQWQQVQPAWAQPDRPIANNPWQR